MTSFFACVGHASVDHHFEIEAFSPRPTKTPAKSYNMIVGGMAANAAIAIARLGAPVRLLGRVGSDSAGDFVRTQVQVHKVQAYLEPVAQAHTSVSSVVVDAQGERQIFNHRGNAIAKAHALDTQQLEGAQALLTDPRWCDGALAALQWAAKRGVLGVLDADIAPQSVLQKLVPAARWAVFSEPGLHCYAPALGQEAALRQALASGAQIAMVTLGERGVVWCEQGSSLVHEQDGFSVRALDTTGAGDVFHAALTMALSENAAHADAVRFASATAALKCTQRQGVLGTPTRSAVEDFLLQNA
jgi:sulfofructose kinase